MSGGSLVVSVYKDFYKLEIFEHRKQGDVIVDQKVLNHEADLMNYTGEDREYLNNEIITFLEGSGVRSGDLYISVFDVPVFVDLDLGGKPKTVSNMIPMEIETLIEDDELDDSVENMDYRFKTGDDQTRVWFLPRSFIEEVKSLKVKGDWLLRKVIPGSVGFEKFFRGEEGVLLDIYEDYYMVYGFKKGEVIYKEKEEIDNEDVPPDEDEVIKIRKLEDDIDMVISDLAINHEIDVSSIHVIEEGEYISRYKEQELGERVYKYDGLSHRVSSGQRKQGDWGLINKPSLISEALWRDKKEAFDFSPDVMDRVPKNVLSFVATVTISLAVVLPSFGYYLDNQVEEVSGDVSSLESDISSVESNIGSMEETIEELKASINGYNDYVTEVGKVNDGNTYFVSDMLNILPSNTPTQVVVKDIQVSKSDKEIEVFGVSGNYKDIGAFAIQLEEYGDVVIEEIDNNELQNQKGYPFRIVLSPR